MNATLGQVVYSKAGRDAGRKFIITGIINEAYVLVSNGDLRRIEKPKKKKVRHLRLTEEVIKILNEKLLNKLKLTNSEIRKALENLDNKETVK